MSSVRSAIVFLCALLVGGTFIVAGVLKSLDVEGFARDIALHGIIGPGPAWLAARLLIPLEIATGVAAIVGYRRRLALAVLLAMLVLFIGATGIAWYTGHTEGCGCFGRYAARTPKDVIVEDLVLAAAAGVGLLLSGRRWPAEIVSTTPRLGRWRGALVATVAAAATVMAFASPYLPIDNIATALRPGVTIADLGLDRITGNLGEGDRLLVVLALDEPRTRDSVPALNALAASPGVPTVTGLTSATEDKRAEFFWSYAPVFELQDVPAADLRRLYRRAPRAFRVHNGAVLQVWDGIPPVEEVAR